MIFIQRWNGAIRYSLIIHKAKSLVSNELLAITDGQENNLCIEMHYINGIEINDRCITLDMDNEITIKIDY